MTAGRAAIAVVVALVVGACGGGDSTLDEIVGSSSTAAGEATGEDQPTGEEASAAGDAAAAGGMLRADYSIGAPPSGSAPLTVGETAQTGGSEYAEIAFFDGSVVRLDVETDVVVAELSDDGSKPAISIEMGSGRTWHRVSPLDEGTAYEVRTPVATAVATGTTFSVSCPSPAECGFAVVEGVIDVVVPDGTTITIEAPTWVTVAADGASESRPLPFDTAFGDDWLLDNGERDQTLGSDGPGELFAEFGVTYASLDGTHDATGTTTRFDCDGPGCDDLSDRVHQPLERTFEFVVECETGACGGQAITEYQYNEEFVTQNVPLRFDGSAYDWDLDTQGNLCFLPDGTVLGEQSARLEWHLTPTQAEVRDNRYLVTAADLDITIEATPVEPTPPECDLFLATYSMDQRHTVIRQS